jgi:alkylated DNA repair protein (DNA oxidative demethylase)
LNGMTPDLFEVEDGPGALVSLAPGAAMLCGLARRQAPALLAGVDAVTLVAPFRHLVTPGGFTMSVAMTNCGALGWVSDITGYRYTANDPLSGQPWPAMPATFMALARDAARQGGFPDFVPDACLVNRYVPGARLTLHQDMNERGLVAPIVSVSLGIPAVFQFGGLKRSDKAQRIPLEHGDVVVWGGPSRMRFHGVLPLKPASHPLTGEQRINLTFRMAG